MKENKSVTLEVSSNEIAAFEKLIENVLRLDPTEINALMAMSLLNNLHQSFDSGQSVDKLNKPKRILSKVKEAEYLNKVIERQRWRISGLMAVPILQGVVNLYTGANNTAIIMDALFDPDGVKLHCTSEHSGEDFMIRPRNILAVESNKKRKTIYLKDGVGPIQGGTKRLHINLDIDFDELLSQINRKSQILFRISNGYAINVFEYVFSKPKIFVLENKPKDKLYKDILERGVDSKFHPNEYFKKLAEIDQYKNYWANFQSNLITIEAITAKIQHFKDVYGSEIEDFR